MPGRRPTPLRVPGTTDRGCGTTAEIFHRAVALFDARRFFDAHEMFERLWKADEVHESDRRFWKGVTQVAVGCCHIQRGNRRGAAALLGRAAGYLRPYPTPHLGTDTSALIAAALRARDELEHVDAGPRFAFFGYPRVCVRDR